MLYSNVPIKDWAVEDRPREKLLKKGISALTDAELLALILATGTRSTSALDLARMLLKEFGGISKIAQASVEELMQQKGIGKAKAISVVAVFELGRRKGIQGSEGLKITHSGVVGEYLGTKLADTKQEVFYVLFLNRNNVVKAEKMVFKGGVSSTIVDVKLIFREAIVHLASAIIVAHNHPSGNLTPSRADRETTKKLVEGAKIFDIAVLDHVIVSHTGYYSFADHGLI